MSNKDILGMSRRDKVYPSIEFPSDKIHNQVVDKCRQIVQDQGWENKNPWDFEGE